MYSKQTNNENGSYLCIKMQREIMLEILLIIQINDLQQRILKASNKAKTPHQALFQAYEMLSEKQKIAFLLAGGAEQLFHYQQQERQEEQRDKTDHTWPRHGRHILALNPCRSFLLSEQGERTKKQLLQAEFPSPEKKS